MATVGRVTVETNGGHLGRYLEARENKSDDDGCYWGLFNKIQVYGCLARAQAQVNTSFVLRSVPNATKM